MEADAANAIRWADGSTDSPWRLAPTVEIEVLYFNICVLGFYSKRSEEADSLAIAGILEIKL